MPVVSGPSACTIICEAQKAKAVASGPRVEHGQRRRQVPLTDAELVALEQQHQQRASARSATSSCQICVSKGVPRPGVAAHVDQGQRPRRRRRRPAAGCPAALPRRAPVDGRRVEQQHQAAQAQHEADHLGARGQHACHDEHDRHHPQRDGVGQDGRAPRGDVAAGPGSSWRCPAPPPAGRSETMMGQSGRSGRCSRPVARHQQRPATTMPPSSRSTP